MDQLPTFIDFEASSLRSASYPIEVAWNDPAGIIEAHLISPAGIDRWTDWSVEAEQLHGISRATLLTAGKPPSWLCRRMNHQLAGTVVYSDDPEYDQMWLATLFAVSVCGGPAFTIHSADDLLVSLVGPHIGGRVQELPQMEAMKQDARRQYAPLRERYPVPPSQILLWPLNDPYMEGLDAYRQCLAQLQATIEAHTPQLLGSEVTSHRDRHR